MIGHCPPVAVPNRLGRARKQEGKRTLEAVLRERGALPTARAVDVALAVCDQLAVAHASGVVHGQLGLGCIRLDFTTDGAPRDVETFALEGDASPFLVPERLLDGPRGAIGFAADVWSVGALLHTMLLAIPPAPGAARVAPESMPAGLAAIVEACLSADPADRPQAIDEVAMRIASYATSPPDHFARLADRHERRAAAERARKSLERRGLGDVPTVLDKLDDAALSRAQRPATAAISSILVGTTTEAAMERLMTAVHAGTTVARVELAAALPALVDFDDDDDEVLPTIANGESQDSVALAPVVCPLSTAPVLLPDAPPEALPMQSPRADRRGLGTAAIAAGVLAVMLAMGTVGYVMSAKASATAATRARADVPSPLPPAAETPLPPPAIPVFTPSALPEAPAVTPSSLPDAKPQR